MKQRLKTYLEANVPLIDEAMVEGLVTVERVEVRLYGSGRSDG